MAEHRVCALAEVPANDNLMFEVAGRPVLICRAPAGLFAVAAYCTHALLELQGGRMRGHWLFCPHHGARFDLRDGSTTGQLTTKGIESYPVRLDGDDVFVTLPD